MADSSEHQNGGGSAKLPPPIRSGPRRLPVLATLVVGLAIAVMIGLGVWQIAIRLPEKEAALAQLAANPSKPEIAFPRTADDSLLFRRARGDCPDPTNGMLTGAGGAGFRWIVECRSAGATMLVQLGTTRDPVAQPQWPGGPVRGTIAYAPDSRSMLASLNDRARRRLMLIADQPAAGLEPNAAPDLAGVPNNHLAYGVQWFFFAAVAAVIYVLALRRRG